MTWATAPALVKRLQAGERADVLILNRAGMDTMMQEGRVVPGTAQPLASSSIALAVKRGAPMPDISTGEALKRALLAAKSISYTDPAAGGASGIYFAKLLERLGIAEVVNAKTRFPPPNGYSGKFLLTGEAELAIQQEPELRHVPGVDIVGLLPADMNIVTVFVSGLAEGSDNVEAGRALLAFLQAPQSRALLRAKGLGLPA